MRKTGWIGYDLGAASVKAAQVVRKNGEYRIRSAAIVPRSPRWEPQTLAEPVSSADELRAASSVGERLAGRVAAAVLPMALCEVAQVGASGGQRWGKAELVRAAEAETQQSLSRHVVDWWPTPLKNDRYNVIAAPLPWSDQISADVAAAGRHCRLIDALPWTLARAIGMLPTSEARRTTVAFDWGYETATACLVHQGAPALVRQLKDCGLRRLVDALERELGVDYRDAETLLRKYGLAGPGSPSCAEAIEYALAEPLDRLHRELKRTLSYWTSQARGSAPQTMYLFGGGGALPGVAKRLREVTSLDVQPWTLPPEDAADAPSLPPACLLGPALGLSALALES